MRFLLQKTTFLFALLASALALAADKPPAAPVPVWEHRLTDFSDAD